ADGRAVRPRRARDRSRRSDESPSGGPGAHRWRLAAHGHLTGRPRPAGHERARPRARRSRGPHRLDLVAAVRRFVGVADLGREELDRRGGARGRRPFSGQRGGPHREDLPRPDALRYDLSVWKGRSPRTADAFHPSLTRLTLAIRALAV